MSKNLFISPAEYLKNLEDVTRATSGISDEPIYRSVVRRLSEIFAQQNAVMQEIRRPMRALDVGSGIGILTRRSIETGIFDLVVGADFLTPDSRLGLNTNWVRCDLNRDLPFSSATFDVVICVEVVEHLENPSELARNLRRVIKKDGLLIISTPNTASLRSCLSLLARGYFPDFGPTAWPVHVTPLLPVNLSAILTAAGFSDLKFWYTNVGAVPKIPGWKFKWQSLDGGHIFRGRLFSDNVVVEGWAR